MEKLLIYYSQNKDKFKTRITRKFLIPKIGSVNQFNEVLVKVINCDELILCRSKNKELYFNLSRLYRIKKGKE